MITQKTEIILDEIEQAIGRKKPFSLIRFGDGGIKYIHAVLFGDDEQIVDIVEKEGIPQDKIVEVFELWGYYARRANYIDTPEVYFTDQFWPRLKGPDKYMSKKTIERMKQWRYLYHCAEFDNENYCNPEINFLLVLKRYRKRNLFDVLRGKKIACITAVPEVAEKLDKFKVDTFEIVKQFEGHYDNSFKSTIDLIREKVHDYDIWLVAAGELGRVYTGLIAELGGRSVDMGFIIEYWVHGEIPVRLQPFLKANMSNPLEMKMEPSAYPFKKYI